jgi:hypothetical protein
MMVLISALSVAAIYLFYRAWRLDRQRRDRACAAAREEPTNQELHRRLLLYTFLERS